MSTSSSRILGSATSFSLKPGAADSLTSAFTSNYSVEGRQPVCFLAARGVQTANCEPLLEVTVVDFARATHISCSRLCDARFTNVWKGSSQIAPWHLAVGEDAMQGLPIPPGNG